MNDISLRIPPHSIEAEQSVLGGILLDNPSYLSIAGLLNDDDFYREDHQLIFRAMKDMASDQQALDVLTVSEWMKGRFLDRGSDKRSFFDVIGGLAYLGDLAKDTPSSANIAGYAKIVRTYALKRKIIHLTNTLQSQAFQHGSDETALTALLEQATAGFFALEQQKAAAKQGFTPMKQALNEQLTVLNDLRDKDGEQLLGASSTLDALDQQLSGFEKGKVYVIAGRPAMGKTTLGLNLVEGIATSTQGVVAVFSLEMNTGQIIEKMMSSQGRVNFSRLRSPWELSASDWEGVETGVKKLRGMDIFFDDSATQSPADLRSRCRRLVRETGKPLSAILIDYVQLMHGSSGKNYPNREAEVSAISGDIRALAKDFSCPVILLSQLNRSLEGRPNKRPIMSDLRESGALEQDASCVLFIYRDEVYDEQSKAKGIAELIIAKHRGGATGTIRCAFVGKNQRFANTHYTKREVH
jgi:replicative DNA helicase